MSYYALFKGWLLLSQPPGCQCDDTSLTTELIFGDLSWRSGLFPSRLRKLALAASLPHSKHTPLRSLQRVGRLVGPRALAVLYRTWSTWEAVPQYISGRTSYLQVRLAFHSYTQLIRDCFSRHRFGPPLPFTGVSTWSCVAHLVSSLAQRTHRRPIRTRFRSASVSLT